MPRTLESLPGTNPAHKIAAVVQGPARPTRPGADSSPHVTSQSATPTLRHWGVASRGGRAAIGRKVGPAACARSERGMGVWPDRPERAAIGLGAWPRAAGGGWGRRRRESRPRAVHLRADARVPEAAPAAVPAAMNRFKVSKFRHTEARPPRREVRPASVAPCPAATLPPPLAQRGDPPPRARLPRGRPLKARVRRPGRPVAARRSEPGAPGTFWALDEHRGPASQRDPRGGAARPVGPRPEAYEAACLPGFRSASPGSHNPSSPPPRSPLPGAGVRERCPFLSWPWRVRVCHWRGGAPRPETRPSLGFPPALPLAAGLSSSPTQGDAAKAWVGRGKPKQVEARERAEPGGGGVPTAPRKGRRPDEGCSSESMPTRVCSETLFGRPGSVFQ